MLMVKKYRSSFKSPYPKLQWDSRLAALCDNRVFDHPTLKTRKQAVVNSVRVGLHQSKNPPFFE